LEVRVPEIVVERRMRGFISLTSHPDGCAANVAKQVATARAGLAGHIDNALVLGSSTGYGLASLLCASFGLGADSLGVCFEREPEGDKTASAGWYNLVEAHRRAADTGLHMETINADAFSDTVKDEVLAALAARFGPLDLVVYSVAAPRRRGPDGETWASVLKPIGETHRGKGLDLRRGTITDLSIDPATDDEVVATQKVMGGEDWQEWIDRLDGAGLLSPGCRTISYSYIGPEVTASIYRNGSIGQAKKHLEQTAHGLNERLAAAGGGAWVAVNKAVVTQSSSAIPAVPLYMSILRPVMAEAGVDEEAIDQIVRLFAEHVGPGRTPTVDAEGRIRLDDRELAADIQAEVLRRWEQISDDSLDQLADFAGYQKAFNQLFGFDVGGVDESKPTEIDRRLS
jgi:enoyl-[acyl-carrier protein] reductase / trans-2-enoyl-CoA reductase (NAD+)